MTSEALAIAGASFHRAAQRRHNRVSREADRDGRPAVTSLWGWQVDQTIRRITFRRYLAGAKAAAVAAVSAALVAAVSVSAAALLASK